MDIHLNELGIAHQLRLLDEKKLDVGFIRPPVLQRPPGIVIETVFSENILLAIDEGHPLAGREKLHIKDLADATFIVPSLQPGTGFYAHSEAVWQSGGFQPRVEHKSPQLATICGLVAAGAGVALVPESLQRVQLPNLLFRTLEGMTRRSQLAIAYRRNEASPAIRAFVEDVSRATSCLRNP